MVRRGYRPRNPKRYQRIFDANRGEREEEINRWQQTTVQWLSESNTLETEGQEAAATLGYIPLNKGAKDLILEQVETIH